MQNSAPIASGLAASSVPRSELFITSKVSAYEQGTEKARASCQAILDGLQTPYLVSTSPLIIRSVGNACTALHKTHQIA